MTLTLFFLFSSVFGRFRERIALSSDVDFSQRENESSIYFFFPFSSFLCFLSFSSSSFEYIFKQSLLTNSIIFDNFVRGEFDSTSNTIDVERIRSVIEHKHGLYGTISTMDYFDYWSSAISADCCHCCYGISVVLY